MLNTLLEGSFADILLKFAVISAVMAIIPALIAQVKGYNFIKWWIYGALALPVAFAHALLLKPGYQRRGSKKCLFCHSMVSIDATYCKKCGYEF